jgi:hypothetical protein
VARGVWGGAQEDERWWTLAERVDVDGVRADWSADCMITVSIEDVIVFQRVSSTLGKKSKGVVLQSAA